MAVDLILGERDRVDQYDIGGQKWKGNESDDALAETVRLSGNVIMLADAVRKDWSAANRTRTPRRGGMRAIRVGELAEPRPVVLAPYQSLADASVGFGHNFIVLDPDGPARRMPPFIKHEGKYLPSLGVAAALRVGGFRPDEVSVDGTTLANPRSARFRS